MNETRIDRVLDQITDRITEYHMSPITALQDIQPLDLGEGNYQSIRNLLNDREELRVLELLIDWYYNTQATDSVA